MALTNAQYDEIMNIYHQRQFRNSEETARRTAEVMNRIPSYRECADTVSELSVSAAKAGLKGDTSLLDTLNSSIAGLTGRMKSLLTEYGYPEDYLSPSYVCPDCRDTGFINNRKCRCFKQAEIDLLYRQSNIKDVLERENFDNFNYNLFSDTVKDPGTGLTPRATMKLAVEKCRRFIREFPSGHNILLIGATGVGKTFLTNCIAREILNSSGSVLYLSAVELFEYFSSKSECFDNSALDNSDISMQIIESDLLIIDDLGTELTNAYTNSRLFYCINRRLLRNRSTIISTNFSLSQLMNTYSERIFSRISSSYEIIGLIGDDIRLTNK